MELKELYNEYISHYKNGDKNTATAYGIEWLSETKDNPFQSNTKERELFFKAKKHYTKWHNKSIDGMHSRKLMSNYLFELAEMDLPNPYEKKVLGIVQTETVEARTEEVKNAETAVSKAENTKPAETKGETIGEIKKRFFKHNKGDEQH